MKIKLDIAGQTKEFQTPYVSALIYRKYLPLKEKVNYLNTEPTLKQLDDLVELVIEAFGKQFTIDEFYAGQSMLSFRETLVEFILETEGVPLDMTEEEEAEVKDKMEADATPKDNE